jgi:cell division protein FtsB
MTKKTWGEYVAEAEQYKHYKQRCEELEAQVKQLEAERDAAQRIADHYASVLADKGLL